MCDMDQVRSWEINHFYFGRKNGNHWYIVLYYSICRSEKMDTTIIQKKEWIKNKKIDGIFVRIKEKKKR